MREEVDKQIAHLKRQANTAERYKVLKEEERELRGQLLVLRWQDYHTAIEKHDTDIREKELELEQVVADQRAVEASIEQDRQNQTEAGESFNQAQAEYYRIGSEVSRLEQAIQHTKESREQQSKELAQLEQSLAESKEHIQKDEERILEIDTAMAADEPAYDELQQSQKFSADLLVQAEQRLAEWQNRWDEWSRRHGESSQIAQVELSRMDQLERGIAQLDARLAKMQNESDSLDLSAVSAQLEQWIAREVELSEEETRLQQKLANAGTELQGLRDALQQAQNELDEIRGKVQSTMGRLASLEALQQAALGQSNQQAGQWLEQNGLAQRPRIAQTVTVNDGWEAAIELVLEQHLDAVYIEDLDGITARLDDLAGANAGLAFIEPGVRPQSSASDRARLLDKLEAGPSLEGLLNGVYCAGSLREALAQRHVLAPGESFVTRDGQWVGPNWLRVGSSESETSVLQREQEIDALKAELARLEETSIALEKRINERVERLDQHEAQRETLQATFNTLLRDTSEIKSRLAGGKQELDQLHSRSARLGEEIAEVRQLREQDLEQVKVARSRRTDALTEIDNLAAQGEALRGEQDKLKAEHEKAREQAEADRSAGQELAIRVESMRNVRATTVDNLERARQQSKQFNVRRDELLQQLAIEEEDPVIKLESSLSEYLQAHVASESSLSATRDALEQVEQRLRGHEQTRLRHENRANSMRETVQNARMESQEVRVRLKTIEEQLADSEYQLELIRDAMSDEATLSVWTERVEELERKIQRLGPINLAAIDEYDEQVQRKEYLDSQHEDVIDALETLEKAIAKIDRETKDRFKATFDSVNQKVQEFFPRLFGGGNANLELTGDDLLSTGVTVMAQPPGKHVTNIHLLSGGEKALTAVALVFAFFELNPSPFCMLDEVDAPLDDANVGRFCQLVKEMSERVQFIFITHNKVTMELAEQLMGVTMNEPGVSRLVAVDVQEAVELAGA